MKKIAFIILLLSLFIQNTFSYEMNQKDLDYSKGITDKINLLISKKGNDYRQRYIKVLYDFIKKHNNNERLLSIVQKSINDLQPRSVLNTKESIGSLSPTDIEKAVILQMTTLCENAPATKLQYNYAEDIGDGRGITFGIIGFTTGTFDGNILLHHYTNLNPNNNLKKYITALDLIDKGAHEDGLSNNQKGLDGFIEDINNNIDPIFKKAQLDILESMYWKPALKYTKDAGAKYPLTLGFIYDITVNHGENMTERLINQTNNKMDGSPKDGIDEKIWLSKLMDFRYEYLKKEYPDGLNRIVAFRKLLTADNFYLQTPYNFFIYGDSYIIDGNVY